MITGCFFDIMSRQSDSLDSLWRQWSQAFQIQRLGSLQLSLFKVFVWSNWFSLCFRALFWILLSFALFASFACILLFIFFAIFTREIFEISNFYIYLLLILWFPQLFIWVFTRVSLNINFYLYLWHFWFLILWPLTLSWKQGKLNLLLTSVCTCCLEISDWWSTALAWWRWNLTC